jgi:pimeloyl-ACP methyl ester carboxylesterase
VSARLPEVDDIGCRVFGRGPRKVLVLPGWFGDERFLEPLHSSLDPESFTYVCMAYRGYGASRHMKGDYSIDEISRDARGLAARLGWDAFSVVGHSMGGKAALRVYLDAPAHVRRIVAVTPVGAGAVPFDRETRLLFERAQMDAASRFAIINHSTGSRLTKTWIQGVVNRSLQGSDHEAFGAYFKSWADSDFSSLVRGDVPVHVLVGRHDASITEAVARATFALPLPNLDFQVIDNAGHYPVDEVPVFFASVLEQLLAG